MWHRWHHLRQLSSWDRMRTESELYLYRRELPGRLLQRQWHLPVQQQPALRYSRDCLRAVSRGNGVPERLVPLHRRELPRWVLPERAVPAGNEQHRVRGQRRHLRQLSGRDRVWSRSELCVHAGQLPRWLLRQ
jgi:hypothetical protein